MGAYFDIIKKTCIPRKEAVPVPGCNRCQYAMTSFVNAVTDSNKCNTYYYCQNGKNGNVSTCPNDYFFNEGDQICDSNSKLSYYANTNGACHGAILEEDEDEDKDEGDSDESLSSGEN